MTDSVIEHCYHSYNGAAVYLSSPIKKTVSILNNRFANNIALNGGAIYCDNCYWPVLKENEF
jgi:predicted outer membrane repeat protein